MSVFCNAPLTQIHKKDCCILKPEGLINHSNALSEVSHSFSDTVISGSPSLDCDSASKHTHIPRPRNAFMFFRSRYVKAYKRTGSSDLQTTLSKDAAKVWAGMSGAEKQEFKDLAEADKASHKANYPNYVYSPGRKKGTPKAKNTTAGGSGIKKRTAASRSLAVKERDPLYSPSATSASHNAVPSGTSHPVSPLVDGDGANTRAFLDEAIDGPRDSFGATQEAGVAESRLAMAGSGMVPMPDPVLFNSPVALHVDHCGINSGLEINPYSYATLAVEDVYLPDVNQNHQDGFMAHYLGFDPSTPEAFGMGLGLENLTRSIAGLDLSGDYGALALDHGMPDIELESIEVQAFDYDYAPSSWNIGQVIV